MGVYDSIFTPNLSGHYFEGLGDLLWQGLGTAYDDLVSAAKVAVRQRFPFFCLNEALPYIAQNLNLDYPARYVGTGTDRLYLLNPWTKWANAGTNNRILTELQFLGYGNNISIVSYRTLVDTMGADPATTFGGISSFFYVSIGQPNPWTVPGNWAGGANWKAAPYTWGSTATAAQVQEIINVIRKWKRAGTSCRYILVDLGGGHSVIWPMWELWEYGTNGHANRFYNFGYSSP